MEIGEQDMSNVQNEGNRFQSIMPTFGKRDEKNVAAPSGSHEGGEIPSLRPTGEGRIHSSGDVTSFGRASDLGTFDVPQAESPVTEDVPPIVIGAPSETAEDGAIRTINPDGSIIIESEREIRGDAIRPGTTYRNEVETINPDGSGHVRYSETNRVNYSRDGIITENPDGSLNDWFVETEDGNLNVGFSLHF